MGFNRTIGFNEDFMEMSMVFVKMMAAGGSRQDGVFWGVLSFRAILIGMGTGWGPRSSSRSVAL